MQFYDLLDEAYHFFTGFVNSITNTRFDTNKMEKRMSPTAQEAQ